MHGARPLRQDRAMKGESETATRDIRHARKLWRGVDAAQ